MTREPSLTPMLRQYQELKARYPGTLLMFRLGDFYELFFDDALVAARELEIVLTSRELGKGRRVPMCGVPYHALTGYLARLVERGHRVAICDQVEDARKAKGLVRRDVTRVVTPGTMMDATLPQREHLYIVAIASASGMWGVAAADLSTGDLSSTQIQGAEADRRLEEELARYDPREVLLPEDADAGSADRYRLTRVEPWRFEPSVARRALIEHFRVASLEGFGAEDLPVAVAAAGALLQYLKHTQMSALEHLRGLRVYSTDDVLGLDETTRRNLELVHNFRDGTTAHTLLSTVDETVTAMGGRLLREWVLRPLVSIDSVGVRQRAVAVAVDARAVRADLREALKALPDLARVTGRIGHGSATPRDLASLRAGLLRLPALRADLTRLPESRLTDLGDLVDPHEAITGHIGRALVDDPPATAKDGGVIRAGYDDELDRVREAASGGKTWIAGLEAAERVRTGVRSLRVGFNKIFGYYLEVSNANRHLVPADYVRKQTLTNAERYITPEMKEREAAILGAEERMAEIETQLFERLRQEVAGQSASLLETSRALAEVDVLLGLAHVAEQWKYVKPELVDDAVLDIRGGRHPVVERLLQGERFVPNDLALSAADRALLIVTGPNMAGKSTLLRQAALITIMAQMGSFVPAAAARIGVADRVFTRVGATDDLASGRSTFLVEMQEVARILHGATPRSVIILDEVGRGTSTYDGMSLAWAVVAYLHDHIGARTLFATHFHELTELADLLPRVRNISMQVREEGDQVVFLHTAVEGRADRSYGIHVAQLAGIPDEVIGEARRILQRLESAAARPAEPEAARLPSRARAGRQLPLALELASPIEEALLGLAIESMTPLEAMQTLAELRERARALRAGAHDRQERRLQ